MLEVGGFGWVLGRCWKEGEWMSGWCWRRVEWLVVNCGSGECNRV